MSPGQTLRYHNLMFSMFDVVERQATQVTTAAGTRSQQWQVLATSTPVASQPVPFVQDLFCLCHINCTLQASILVMSLLVIHALLSLRGIRTISDLLDWLTTPCRNMSRSLWGLVSTNHVFACHVSGCMFAGRKITERSHAASGLHLSLVPSQAKLVQFSHVCKSEPAKVGDVSPVRQMSPLSCLHQLMLDLQLQ